MKKLMLTIITCTLAAFMCVAAQCMATTKKGMQCKRQASPDSSYCRQHGGKSSAHVNSEAGVMNAEDVVDTSLCIKAFEGVPFGAYPKEVIGFPVKDADKKMYMRKYSVVSTENLKEVTFLKPFHVFKKGVVEFDSNDRSCEVITECCYPASKKKSDVLAELAKVQELLKEKYGVELGKQSSCLPKRARANRLSVMGLGSGVGSNRDVVTYRDKKTEVSLSCERYDVANKAMKGPNVNATVEAYKLVLRVSSRWYLSTDDQNK